MYRYFSQLTMASAMLVAWAVGVHAQDYLLAQPSARSRPAVFNPFEVGPSRVTLNPFGVFRVADVTPFANPFTTRPAASSAAGGGGAASSSSTANDPPIFLMVRPPYVPPPRSPWRPPPRPPFLPP
jgi:hypothetical protein